MTFEEVILIIIAVQMGQCLIAFLIHFCGIIWEDHQRRERDIWLMEQGIEPYRNEQRR